MLIPTLPDIMCANFYFPRRDICANSTVTLTVSNGSRSRKGSATSPPPTSPPSPPPPFTRSHKRRLNKSLSGSPPPPEPYSSSYIFKPCMVRWYLLFDPSSRRVWKLDKITFLAGIYINSVRTGGFPNIKVGGASNQTAHKIVKH